MNTILLGKTIHDIVFVLTNASNEIVGQANVKRSILSASHNIDEVSFHR
jgi:hypothetical protein